VEEVGEAEDRVGEVRVAVGERFFATVKSIFCWLGLRYIDHQRRDRQHDHDHDQIFAEPVNHFRIHKRDKLCHSELQGCKLNRFIRLKYSFYRLFIHVAIISPQSKYVSNWLYFHDFAVLTIVFSRRLNESRTFF
jgi:hypothetical protein